MTIIHVFEWVIFILSVEKRYYHQTLRLLPCQTDTPQSAPLLSGSALGFLQPPRYVCGMRSPEMYRTHAHLWYLTSLQKKAAGDVWTDATCSEKNELIDFMSEHVLLQQISQIWLIYLHAYVSTYFGIDRPLRDDTTRSISFWKMILLCNFVSLHSHVFHCSSWIQDLTNW